jgi:NAD/NADP transhydrogenase beta subunit
MTDHAVPTPDDPGQAPPSVRAQLLATEHWSLLASRSTTQSEVLTRISIFLTLTSAGLVSLALAGQAMHFDGTFQLLAMIVLAIVLGIGILTQIRVFNVGFEDLGYVLAMNRLRAAYAELDPSIRSYLMTSTFDDGPGSQDTYVMFGRRSSPGHFAGSSMMLIATVNAALVGLFVAGIVASFGVPSIIALVAGLVGGALYLVIVLQHSYRRFTHSWSTYEPRFPSPPASTDPR